MNSPQCGLRLAGTLFGLVCLAHLLRLLIGFQIRLGGYQVPLWMNGAAAVFTGLLAVWLWRLSLRAGNQAPPAKV